MKFTLEIFLLGFPKAKVEKVFEVKVREQLSKSSNYQMEFEAVVLM